MILADADIHHSRQFVKPHHRRPDSVGQVSGEHEFSASLAVAPDLDTVDARAFGLVDLADDGRQEVRDGWIIFVVDPENIAGDQGFVGELRG